MLYSCKTHFRSVMRVIFCLFYSIYYGGAGPCCKVDDLFTYLIFERPEIWEHIKFALHCDDGESGVVFLVIFNSIVKRISSRSFCDIMGDIWLSV